METTTVRYQVRRAPKLRVGSEHQKPWIVTGGGRGMFSVRVACQTKREAHYRKARLQAGLDPFGAGEQRVGDAYVDADGVWQ